MLSLLAARFARLDLAEDALGDAFEAAARTWPRDGVPANPPAWLLTAARRRALDRLRAEAVAARSVPELVVEHEAREEAQRVMADAGEEVTDERLRLVLLCAHPRLPRENAAALTLRLVLGVSTEDVARLFLVPTATMAARLTRARKRLAGAELAVPSGAALAERTAVAAEAAYLAFTAAYAPGSGDDVVRADGAGEAVRLVRVLRDVAPPGAAADGELDALLALVLLQHSRRDARVRDGRLVLLADQDRRRWRHDEVAEALALLTPLTRAPAAPYLLQALVAAEHAVAPTPGATRWDRVVARYDELLALAGSPVVRLNRAVALAERDGPDAGLAALAGLTTRDLPGHRLPAVRAELLARTGRDDDAVAALEAYDTALTLCRNEAERAHLLRRRDEVSSRRRPRG
ncbi:DUF6596 domain-containing protein [Nocardioides zeae]|uniref:DUF6596 domain-containing protein n=1 Tax=Nocardioides imazamoxiresistens TaxID=3231893 RepID=A0ABU3PZG4_9ACTN|nr:DUF6596 domain-containing protein [Nocardioides zeae]MDT9594192.1 DUF6596 domain-containing protein [Nocardioides zeae]